MVPRIAHVHKTTYHDIMTWKRIAFAAVSTVILVPVSYFVSEAVITAWCLYIDPHLKDGQVGLGIIMGSLYSALAVGLLTPAVILTWGR
jgi:hypothetical protein